jgi:predicted CXXCH cytochrome family protein
MSQRGARTGFAIAAAVACAVAATAAWQTIGSAEGDKPAPSPNLVAPAEGYVGAKACQGCHSAAYEVWSHSTHALALVPGRADALPPDAAAGGTVEHPPGKTTFRKAGEGYVATTTGEDGKPHDYPLDFVVGRRRIHMFVARMDDGRLQVLPGMYAQPKSKWFDYTYLIFGAPGEDMVAPPPVAPGDPSFWTGPVRAFDVHCARCHTSGMQPVVPADGRGPRSSWRALGVDCESCHGPAAAHVAYRQGEKGAPQNDPMPHLKSLDRTASLSVCLRCHMEADVVKAGMPVGGDVYEHVTPTLMDGPDTVDPAGRAMELVYEGVSFGASVCAEAGKMTCLDCHEPHGSPTGVQLKKEVEGAALCARCHEEVAKDAPKHAHHKEGGAGVGCVGCHMPPLTIERGHGAIHDHTIGVPNPSLGKGFARDACTGCHTGSMGNPAGVPALSAEKIRAAYEDWWPGRDVRPPWVAAIAAGRETADGGVAALRDVVKDPEVPRFARAAAANLYGAYGTAGADDAIEAAKDPDSLVRRAAVAGLATVRTDAADAALLRALSDRSAPVRVAAAQAALQGFERVGRNAALLAAALPMLEEDAQAVPGDDLRWFRLGAAREIAKDWKGAIEAYRRQVALDPFAGKVRDQIRKLEARVAGGGK